MSGARTHGSLNDEEVNGAAWAAGRGAVVGAAKVRAIQPCSRRKIDYMKIGRSRVQSPKTKKPTNTIQTQWGIFSAVAGLAAFQFSPLYRGLTFQFKV
jgi:hypothetical protein